MSGCVVPIIVPFCDAPLITVNPGPVIKVKVEPELTRVVTVYKGLKGDTGPEGPPGPSGGGLNGVVVGSDFSGTPKKYAVVFADALDSTNYAIAISGTDPRIFTYESKSVFGFTINANANEVLSGEVSWVVGVSSP